MRLAAPVPYTNITFVVPHGCLLHPCAYSREIIQWLLHVEYILALFD